MFDALAQTPVHERWGEQRYPLPIVAAIIRWESTKDNKNTTYLLIRRNSNPYQGMWALVGGKWDFGETMSQAIIREVLEETGLETAFVALRGIVNERLAADSAVGDPAHFIIFVCDLLVSSGTAREQKEGQVAWFTEAELETLNREGAIVPSDFAMLQRFVPASSIPYSEAAMAVDGQGKPTLHRFMEMEG